jgi:hypothetical protein
MARVEREQPSDLDDSHLVRLADVLDALGDGRLDAGAAGLANGGDVSATSA